MNKDMKIYVAGHKGMVGSAILRRLREEGYERIVVRDRSELDLLSQIDVELFFRDERPDVVFLAAARVGGIMANMTNQAAFLYENLTIQNNVMHAAAGNGTKRFVFLSSSCAYPRDCPQPMKEEYLLTGPVEPTNEGYAIAKIAGMKLLHFYSISAVFSGFSAVPCNLYGVNDNFDLETGHVLSSLVRRIVDARDNGVKQIVLWGTGNARRELMDVDDMVDALFFVMRQNKHYDYLNIGTGIDIAIRDLADLIASCAKYEGIFEWDVRRPDGMPRKCLDVSHLEDMGWRSKVPLASGVKKMISIYESIKTGGDRG